MNEHRLTSGNFDSTIRHDLRFKHGFDHEDLERTKNMVTAAIEHVEHKTGSSSGLGAHHLETAIDFLHKHDPEWHALPPHKREHIETALKAHFGITDKATPE